ncbi:MAG: hypothetical protein HZB41_00345 [Ignavibacteriae bacterium]|nr:hypothetical protein [Ignavibacteriota bacterium]
MNNTKEKTFDCLEFKYKAQERIYNDIKNLSPEEEKAYFNRKVKEGSYWDIIGLIINMEVDKHPDLIKVN